MILLLLVLYLETWKTLITTIKKNKYKVLLIHFLLVVGLSFGLSKVEFIDYKKVDENQLKYSPVLDLPMSYFGNTAYFDYFKDVYLDDSRNKVLFGYYENSIEDSYTDFLDFKLRSGERFQKNVSVRISANRNSNMGFIKNVENKIREGGINYLIYAVKADDISAKRFSFSGIKVSLKDSLISEDDLIEPLRRNNRLFYSKIENKIYGDTLRIAIHYEIKIDGLVIPKKMLIRKFLKHIDNATVFEYNYDNETGYENYIAVLSAHFKALHTIRDENRKVELKWDSDRYKYLNKDAFQNELKRLRQEFTFNYIENYNMENHVLK
jgi:hypothetical protein